MGKIRGEPAEVLRRMLALTVPYFIRRKDIVVTHSWSLFWTDRLKHRQGYREGT